MKNLRSHDIKINSIGWKQIGKRALSRIIISKVVDNAHYYWVGLQDQSFADQTTEIKRDYCSHSWSTSKSLSFIDNTVNKTFIVQTDLKLTQNFILWQIFKGQELGKHQAINMMDNYAKDGKPGAVWPLFCFTIILCEMQLQKSWIICCFKRYEFQTDHKNPQRLFWTSLWTRDLSWCENRD